MNATAAEKDSSSGVIVWDLAVERRRRAAADLLTAYTHAYRRVQLEKAVA